MKSPLVKGILSAFAIIVLLLIAGAWYFSPLLGDMNSQGKPLSIYIDADDTADSVMLKVNAPRGWKQLHAILKAKTRTGHYTISQGDNAIDVYRKLQNGIQTPVRLTIPQVRTMEQLAGILSRRIMLDSVEMSTAFSDTAFCSSYGYTKETLPALFIANTYEVWWNMSLDNFMQRMQRENRIFWTPERSDLASRIGLTHEQVVTLASIVAEETAYVPEMPKVAGLYLHRLQLGMPLQADPTVKFALGDFSMRRIYLHHLQTESPYNTYLNTGLPPGPIRIPSVKAIDAVLHNEQHGYIYMCAKEDFSGSHNFARTYAEHLANARRYTQALNRRGIK